MQNLDPIMLFINDCYVHVYMSFADLLVCIFCVKGMQRKCWVCTMFALYECTIC